jgi:hypothetical protein
MACVARSPPILRAAADAHHARALLHFSFVFIAHPTIGYSAIDLLV